MVNSLFIELQHGEKYNYLKQDLGSLSLWNKNLSRALCISRMFKMMSFQSCFEFFQIIEKFNICKILKNVENS